MYIEQFLPEHKENLSKNNAVIALDGMPGAGKSTTLKALSACYKRAPIVPEYTRFTEIPRKFPPKTPDEAKLYFNRFIEVERIRKKKLESLQTQMQPGNLLLLDRTFLGLLAFEFASRSQTGIDIFPWAIREIYRLRDQLIIPDHIFFMDVDNDTAKTRAEHDIVHERRKHYYQADFSGRHREFYIMIAERAPTKITFSNSALPTQEIVQNLSGIINTYTNNHHVQGITN